MDKNFEKELSEFFEKNKKYNGYKENETFIEIYKWIREPMQVYEMMAICKNERPAIEGIVDLLEEKFGENADLDLRKDFIKQMIGTVVKHILNYYGYVQTIQKTFFKGKGKWFRSGTHYVYDDAAPKIKKLEWNPVVRYLNE